MFVAGFVIFAAIIARFTPSSNERADGIVVLTGGEHRLIEAARLLSEGRGTRLLISGVNPITSRDDLLRKSGMSNRLFECCVDVGYAAHDTKGNASETRNWAIDRKFAKLIIVTSSYHMPRSLIELGRAMPEVELVAYPVVSRAFQNERWWTHGGMFRLLLSEYVKFLPSAARYGIARLVRWENGALAKGVQPDHART
jgi:uncharacterized SAM-binding protein YcdF (DUF218 family)